jgi:hypothetical protein
MCLGVGDKKGSSVVRRRLSARAVLLDVLGFPVVDLDDLLAVVALEPQNLIQLRMQSLKLAVLGAPRDPRNSVHWLGPTMRQSDVETFFLAGNEITTNSTSVARVRSRRLAR